MSTTAFTIFNKHTGEIIRSGFIQKENISVDSDDFDFVLQSYDDGKYYYDNGEFKEKGLQPNSFYFFDYSLKKWIVNEDLMKASIISNRNLLLSNSDWTQLPNGPFTQEQQQAWAVYRQQLRDITSQSGYPFNVVWPTQPE